MILNVAVFFPTYVKKRNQLNQWTGEGLDTRQVSLVIAIFQIAQIVNAPISAKIKNYLGSKNTFMLGFLMLTTSNFGLGYIAHLDSPNAFYCLALFLRFVEGQGDVLLQFTGYSVITQIYSDDLTTHIVYIEIAVGLGLSLGPMAGALVYPYL